MDNRIPEALVPALENYVSLVERCLPDFLNAFYIVGSVALDEFNPNFSDVDFVAVASHSVTDNEVETLRKIHLEVEQRYPNWKLSGLYLLQNDLWASKVGKSEEGLSFTKVISNCTTILKRIW